MKLITTTALALVSGLMAVPAAAQYESSAPRQTAPAPVPQQPAQAQPKITPSSKAIKAIIDLQAAVNKNDYASVPAKVAAAQAVASTKEDKYLIGQLQLKAALAAKDNAGMGSLYRSQHELVLVFKNGTKPHRNNVQLGQFGRNRTNVWQYPAANHFGRRGEEGDLLDQHPTPKPVALVADALLDSSVRGALVLDPFLGSGSTLIAAERIGRVCRGIELDPVFVDLAIRRWQRFTGEQARHAGTGRRFHEVARDREPGHG